MAQRSMDDRLVREDKESAHFILLAKDGEGFKNLMKLSSLAFTKGFYYKPRIDYDVLQHTRKGS
jgi:DNA polymerase-3 subunit alpha